jgi:surface antigen
MSTAGGRRLSGPAFRNVLVILDGGRTSQAAFDSALAEVTRSAGRLTIIATVDRWAVWGVAAAGSGSACVDAVDFEQIAEQTLARAMEQVPADVPVVGMVHASPIAGSLVAERVWRSGHDLVVTPAGGYGRWWRLGYLRASGRLRGRPVTRLAGRWRVMALDNETVRKAY